MASPDTTAHLEYGSQGSNLLYDEMKHTLEQMDGLRKRLQRICHASSELLGSLVNTDGRRSTKEKALHRLEQCKRQVQSSLNLSQGKMPYLGMHILGSGDEIYQLTKLLNVGGMGIIFLTKRLSDQRPIVAKFLYPSKMKDQREVLRFIMESQALIALEHENLVEGLDFNYTTSHIYYLMEYLEGETILDRLNRETIIDWYVAARIVMDVARALEYLDHYGLVHRDIKPGNIFIGKERSKLLDFGIAKRFDCSMTSQGVVIGTPHYLSPEQATLSDLDIRSDIYSLGTTFYHMVVGQLPFDGETVTEIIHQRLYHDPRPMEKKPELPSQLCAIIERMMSSNLHSRYQSPAPLIQDLESFLNNYTSHS